MDITVTGKQIDIGDALRSHVDERVRAMVAKYFDRPTDATVTFSKDAHLFKCDCLTHLSTGLTAQASAENTEIYAACDAAIAKLEKQLRRYKRRLKDHHKKRKEPAPQLEATSYLLASEEEADSVDAAPEIDQEAFWAPTIVAESSSAVPSLSVGEAVMQLELSQSSFLLFWDDASKRVNLVHKREDGHIGWIDPRPPA